jgi:hypothetical protein
VSDRKTKQTKQMVIGIGAALLLGALLLFVIWFVFLSNNQVADDGKKSETAEILPPAKSNAELSAFDKITVPTKTESVCGLKAHDSSFVDSSVAWEQVGENLVPTSKVYGGNVLYIGGQAVSGFRQCYSPDKTGAAFAAMNYLVCSQDAFCILDLYADGIYPALDDLSDVPSNDVSQEMRVLGYAVNEYSEGKADISVLFNAENQEAVFRSIYVWDTGDWKMYLENKRPVTGIEPVSEANDFIRL